MDDPFVIFILIAVVWQVIGGVLGAGRKKGPTGTSPPPRETKRPRQSSPRPVRRTPLPEQLDRPRATDRAESGRASRWDAPAEPAADRAEKPWWETPEAGDAPPARARAPEQPTTGASGPWRDDPERPAGPVVQTPEELWEILTGQRSPFPAPQAPPTPAPEPASREPVLRAPRPEPAGDADVVSLEGDSLEATEISDEIRHREFHAKIDRKVAPSRRIRALDRLGLEDAAGVRRAVVLAEVLGKPRALSDPDW